MSTDINQDSNVKHVQISFAIENEDGSAGNETMWAVEHGDGFYKLDNTPYYAYGVSYGDVIKAESNADGSLSFSVIEAKSGNRTLRIIFDAEEVHNGTSETILSYLDAMACAYEGADASYYAISAPADTELSEVIDHLNDNEIMWECADPIDES